MARNVGLMRPSAASQQPAGELGAFHGRFVLLPRDFE
jgi:hypothetical protein